MLNFVDSHCHIHTSKYYDKPEEVIKRSNEAGVTRLITVGTDDNDSLIAAQFANKHENIWASIGLIPHEAKLGRNSLQNLNDLVKHPKVVAIGECGLDYYYLYSTKTDQIKALEYQIELALESNLPLIFHIRDAFGDFWHIFDQYTGVNGVVHSFSANKNELDNILSRGLYIGLNGITTFTKNQDQLDAFKDVPLEKLLLETDAPYLTPTPLRGTINESKNIPIIAEYLCELRGDKLEEMATTTTSNTQKLFRL